MNATSGFSPTTCPRHHHCDPALPALATAIAIAAHHQRARNAYTAPPSLAQPPSMWPSHTPPQRPAYHPTHPPSTPPNKQSTTLVHQPPPTSNPPPKPPYHTSRLKLNHLTPPSSPPSPQPGNTTTTSHPRQHPTSRTTTATSVVPATRPSRGLLHSAFTRTRTQARNPSAAPMPAAARPSPCAAI